jgi:hypothetical protein
MLAWQTILLDGGPVSWKKIAGPFVIKGLCVGRVVVVLGGAHHAVTPLSISSFHVR